MTPVEIRKPPVELEIERVGLSGSGLLGLAGVIQRLRQRVAAQDGETLAQPLVERELQRVVSDSPTDSIVVIVLNVGNSARRWLVVAVVAPVE